MYVTADHCCHTVTHRPSIYIIYEYNKPYLVFLFVEAVRTKAMCVGAGNELVKSQTVTAVMNLHLRVLGVRCQVARHADDTDQIKELGNIM